MDTRQVVLRVKTIRKRKLVGWSYFLQMAGADQTGATEVIGWFNMQPNCLEGGTRRSPIKLIPGGLWPGK